jgi:hypothetical protein
MLCTLPGQKKTYICVLRNQSFCPAGHIHWVVSLDLHPSQDWLLSASVDNTLRNVLMALLSFYSLTTRLYIITNTVFLTCTLLSIFNTVFGIPTRIDFGVLNPDPGG